MIKLGDKIKFMSNNKKTFKEKLEEIRIIDEAKLLLIKKEGLSEEEAHKKIEKAAMNQRTTRRKIAEAIIQDMKVDHEIK